MLVRKMSRIMLPLQYMSATTGWAKDFLPREGPGRVGVYGRNIPLPECVARHLRCTPRNP